MTFVGETVLVELLSPGFVVGWAGAAVSGEVLDGVLGVELESVLPEGAVGELIVPVVPAGVVAASGVAVEPLLIELDDDGVDVESVLGVELVDPVVAVLPVVDVLEGFDIVLSVFGVSVLLQAPSAASVAATAIHFIERCMSSPRGWGAASVPRPASSARR